MELAGVHVDGVDFGIGCAKSFADVGEAPSSCDSGDAVASLATEDEHRATRWTTDHLDCVAVVDVKVAAVVVAGVGEHDAHREDCGLVVAVAVEAAACADAADGFGFEDAGEFDIEVFCGSLVVVPDAVHEVEVDPSVVGDGDGGALGGACWGWGVPFVKGCAPDVEMSPRSEAAGEQLDE